MQTITHTKMRDQVSEQIKQYIIERKLMLGDRLPTEHQLSESFGISRLSVRESIKKVEFRKVGVDNHLRLVDFLAAGQVDAASAKLRKQIEDNKKRL